MALYKILLVLGLASVSPFSIAQQIVEPGNQKRPYQPPWWFVRLANPESTFAPEMDGFVGLSVDRSYPVSKRTGIKYPCLVTTDQGEKTWQFCDMH